MAIAPLSFSQPQAYSNIDQSQWDRLANLGNIYREAQDRQRKEQALSALGTDPQANLRTLLTSGDPALAQLGLNLQQKDIERAREDVRYGVTDKRANALLAIQQAAAGRAQKTFEQEQADRDALAKIIGGLGGETPPATRPFPAPLPQAAPQAAPPIAPPPPQAPSAFEATPRVPAELQPTEAPAPRVKAEDEETGLPSWAADPSGLASRAASNLLSGQPLATAGISREQLAAMYANSLTRPLATALLQKQMDPGTWSYQQVGDKLIGTSTRGQTKVVMEDTKPLVVGEHALVRDPNSPTGFRDVAPPSQKPVSRKEGEQLFVADPTAPGGYREIGGGGTDESKLQREIRQRTEAARAAGYSKEDADFYGLNAKLPKEDLSPTQQKRVDTLTDQRQKADQVLQNIAQMRELSKGAWGFRGAGPASLAASTVLPKWAPGYQGALDTQDLINAANYNVVTMAKATFPQRVTNMDVKLLQDLEGSANQPDAVREKILDRAERVFKAISNENTAEAEAIINRTRYKPGGTPQTTSPTSALQWKIIK